MDLFYTLLFIGLLWMLLRVIFPVAPELPILITGHPAHGHRCFSEGLNLSEKRIVKILSHGLSHKEYFIFNNLIVPTRGVSTQIDHVVVSRFGIFVIETKHSSAWIFGNADSKYWTTLYFGKKMHALLNPIRQNYGHVMALKSLLPFVEDNFFNVVVFTGNCSFKTKRIDAVLYESELVEYIKNQTAEKLSPQRLLMAIGKLSYLCQTADVTPQQHISMINSQLAKKEIEKRDVVTVGY